MRADNLCDFLILSLVVSFMLQLIIEAEPKIQNFVTEEKTRRILHQPLFPSNSETPPPPTTPPPPPTSQVSPDQDQPFFHELPTGPTVDHGDGAGQNSPSTSTNTPAAVSNPVATKPTNSAKKIGILVSSGILTLVMVSALAFYLFKQRSNQTDESRKIVGGNARFTNEESRMPPSTFLYIGTVEPSARSLVNETANYDANGSPYQKLKPGKRSERYRPSPELQPLPPLTKPPLPPSINSPPPMSSSDDESNDTNFYTPQGSSMSNESPGSRHSHRCNNIGQLNQNIPETRTNTSVPHSKRTSPKSRLSASSPDTKPVMIQSKNQSLLPSETSSLGPSQPSKTLSFTPKRAAARFSAPPPPPDMARLQSIINYEQQTSKIPNPPPPPPQPLSAPRKFGPVETNVPLQVSKLVTRLQLKTPSPKATPRTEKLTFVEEESKSSSSSEIHGADDKDGSKPKLKPLHWDKVRATSDRDTVWNHLKSSSFQLNEDAMESLFGFNSANSVPKEGRKLVIPSLDQENRVLDPKKSQNIAILLRALNVTREEVCEALLDGNPEGLGPELLETLLKMEPTKEEEIKLKNYNDEGFKLGSPERFLKSILAIPFAFKRVESMLYRANFDTEVNYLQKSFQTLEEASEELKKSRLFLKLLEAVLKTGNRMNDGTNRGDARAFKLDTLLKLVDIKGTDGKTTLLHFVVEEIVRSEGAVSDPTSENLPIKTTFREEEFKKRGLQIVSGLSKELGSVKNAAGMDSDILSSYVSKLETGLEKVRLVLQYEKQSMQGKFCDSMKEFLGEATEEIYRLKSGERKALSLVTEVTEYFHGDAAKEEARPLRIFLIVRDFLSILDNVCKDIGRMQERTTIGAGKSFRIPVTAPMPVLDRYNTRRCDRSSDEDSM